MDSQTQPYMDLGKEVKMCDLCHCDLEGESKDASGRGNVLSQPFGLGPHQPQDLCFGTVSHGPLQQGLQGLPGRQMKTMSAEENNQKVDNDRERTSVPSLEAIHAVTWCRDFSQSRQR